MTKKKNSISSVERQYRILSLLEKSERISVPVICSQFSVSEATARRDLEALAAAGLIERFHGGAIMKKGHGADLPIPTRSKENMWEKQQIGAAAAKLVKDGETIFLASGSTVLEVANQLRNHKNLTILTNSLPVINALVDIPTFELVCMGGVLRRSEMSFIGHISEKALEEIRADKVFLGIYALSVEDGLTHDFLPERMTDRAILEVGRQLIIVADHTKIDRTSATVIAPIEKVDTLVTDDQVDEEYLERLREVGVKVVVASQEHS